MQICDDLNVLLYNIFSTHMKFYETKNLLTKTIPSNPTPNSKNSIYKIPFGCNKYYIAENSRPFFITLFCKALNISLLSYISIYLMRLVSTQTLLIRTYYRNTVKIMSVKCSCVDSTNCRNNKQTVCLKCIWKLFFLRRTMSNYILISSKGILISRHA